MALIKAPAAAQRSADTRKQDRDSNMLTAQLADRDPVNRRWAAHGLATCSDASRVLVDRLTIESDSAVREMILSSLTLIQDDVAIAGLVACLRSEDAGLRNEAIDAMKQLPDAVAPIMHGLLKDSDADVRIFAVNILESLRHPNVESWLIDVIEHDATLNVCATAVDLLVEVGTAAAREPLRRLQARYPDEPYIQFAAALALKRMIDE
jgi:HEAT repeat protein